MNFWTSRMDLFDQENGMGEMWEDFMSDPALVQDVLAPSKDYEWGNVLSHRDKTTLGVVLRDRLMTDAALGGPRPIKAEHSYSMLAASPPASPATPEDNQQITNSTISSIQNPINSRKQIEPKSIGLRTKIDDMEEECYPAIPMNTASGRGSSSNSANNLQTPNIITVPKRKFSQIDAPVDFIIKGEPISEPNSPQSSCLPLDFIEDKKNITMVSPSQVHFGFKHFPHSTSESEEDDEEYYQNMDVECEIKDSGEFQNRKRSRQGLPPTPPSSASSDSEGTPSASCSPERRNSQSTSHVPNLRGLLSPRIYVTNNGHSTRQPIHTSLISCQPKGSTGSLTLTDEEKRTLIAEGYPVPTKMPLTKQEEKSLKKVRRKIKNKISAQESRRKKKEYMDGLERRVNLLSNENLNYRNRVTSLEDTNRNLHEELKRLQALVSQSS